MNFHRRVRRDRKELFANFLSFLSASFALSAVGNQ